MHGEIKVSLDQALQDVEVVSRIEVLAQAIMEITNQTNLLSLNASIEAARAGEMGKRVCSRGGRDPEACDGIR